MGLFDWLMRQVASRAEARSDLVNVGALGGVADLADLLPWLPPRDAFGEAASDAALRILARASAEELATWQASHPAAPRWMTIGTAEIEASRDLGSLALAAFHPRADVRAAAAAKLEATGGALATTIASLARERAG